jgi:hypothetical protein
MSYLLIYNIISSTRGGRVCTGIHPHQGTIVDIVTTTLGHGIVPLTHITGVQLGTILSLFLANKLQVILSVVLKFTSYNEKVFHTVQTRELKVCTEKNIWQRKRAQGILLSLYLLQPWTFNFHDKTVGVYGHHIQLLISSTINFVSLFTAV